MRRICLALVSVALLPAAAAALDKLPDGTWAVKLVGQGPNPACYGSIGFTGRIRDGRPVYSGEARYTYKISPQGVLVAAGSRRNDRASAYGVISSHTAQGTFVIPTRNCRGKWEAMRVGT